METEKDNTLPSLDVLEVGKSDGSLRYAVHR
jgi:hypothetical protein